MVKLSVLSVDGLDSGAVLFVATETERLLFNCSEGTQRLCVEHKVRLSKLSSIFMTDISHETTGGLPGLCLTLADAGRRSVSIWGPKGLNNIWETASTFCRRDSISISVEEQSESLQSKSYSFSGLDVSSLYVGSSHLCYVCTTPRLQGKFNIEKAKQLNVPKGPLYAKLKSGFEVTLVDGRTVSPLDVLDEAEGEKCLAIICNLVNCSESDINRCLADPFWDRYINYFWQLKYNIHMS